MNSNNDNKFDLPLGFTMALSRNLPAMEKFSRLPDSEKALLVQKAHTVNSKSEMEALVDRIATNI